MKKNTFLLFGSFTFFIALSSTAFALLFAELITRARLYIYGVAICAAILNVVVSALLAFALFVQYRSSGHAFVGLARRRASLLIVLGSLFIVLAAAGFSLTTLLWMQLRPNEAVKTAVGRMVFGLLKAAFCLSGLSFISQIYILIYLLERSPAVSDRQPLTMNEKDDEYSETMDTSTSTAGPSTPHQETPDSTKLSSNTIVEAAQRASYSATTRKVPRLEPIPGSRPNSPAKPLDGPFPADGKSTDLLSPDSSRPGTGSSRSSNPSINETRVAPRFRTRPSKSQPTSPVIDESHIHPLFRTDSPMPPPTPTVGTTVTASAFGGRTMSARSLSRASSRSRSRSPLGFTPGTRSRSGSYSSSMIHPPSRVGHPALSRSQSLEAVKSGRLSPPAVALTAPMPNLSEIPTSRISVDNHNGRAEK